MSLRIADADDQLLLITIEAHPEKDLACLGRRIERQFHQVDEDLEQTTLISFEPLRECVEQVGLPEDSYLLTLGFGRE